MSAIMLLPATLYRLQWERERMGGGGKSYMIFMGTTFSNISNVSVISVQVFPHVMCPPVASVSDQATSQLERHHQLKPELLVATAPN